MEEKEIVLARVTTGELIVGKFEKKTGDILEPFAVDVDIETPSNIVAIPDNKVKIFINFRPLYFPFSAKTERIYSSALISPPIPAPKDIQERYIQFVSGIVIAKNNNLIDFKKFQEKKK